jgi:hypothetical protein
MTTLARTTRWTSAFALVALSPVGLNVAAWGGTATIVPLCSEQSAVGAVVISPLLPAGPGEDERPDCIKGCHAGAPRKRSLDARTEA